MGRAEPLHGPRLCQCPWCPGMLTFFLRRVQLWQVTWHWNHLLSVQQRMCGPFQSCCHGNNHQTLRLELHHYCTFQKSQVWEKELACVPQSFLRPYSGICTGIQVCLRVGNGSAASGAWQRRRLSDPAAELLNKAERVPGDARAPVTAHSSKDAWFSHSCSAATVGMDGTGHAYLCARETLRGTALQSIQNETLKSTTINIARKQVCSTKKKICLLSINL